MYDSDAASPESKVVLGVAVVVEGSVVGVDSEVDVVAVVAGAVVVVVVVTAFSRVVAEDAAVVLG